jgi:integrase
MATPTSKTGLPTRQTAYTRVGECLWRNNANGIYYAFIKRRGKQFHHSLKTTDRQLAERRLTKLRDQVSNLCQTKEASRITFSALADRWFETVRCNLKPASALRRTVCLKQLKQSLGSLVVRNITARDCDEWVIKRANNISASSFNKERDTLRRILQFAIRDGVILDNPASHIDRRKLGTPHITIPTKPQFSLLVQTITAGDPRAGDAAALIELLAYSGMRLAEATNLTWGEIDFDRGVFAVTGGEGGTKNHEARTVPLFPAMRQMLEQLRASRNPGESDRIIGIKSAKKALMTACRKAGLPHFTHHAMRHYFVSNAIEAGVDFKVVAGWVGHKDGGVLVAKTYGHLRDAHSFEMAKRMTFSTEEPPGNVIALKETNEHPH